MRLTVAGTAPQLAGDLLANVELATSHLDLSNNSAEGRCSEATGNSDRAIRFHLRGDRDIH